jgi:hypothetical protein
MNPIWHFLATYMYIIHFIHISKHYISYRNIDINITFVNTVHFYGTLFNYISLRYRIVTFNRLLGAKYNKTERHWNATKIDMLATLFPEQTCLLLPRCRSFKTLREKKLTYKSYLIWRVTSSEMWRHVFRWKFTNISGENTDSVFKV